MCELLVGLPDVEVLGVTEPAGDGSVTRKWDSLGALTDVTRAGRQVSCTYDQPGQIHQITYPGGHLVTESWR